MFRSLCPKTKHRYHTGIRQQISALQNIAFQLKQVKQTGLIFVMPFPFNNSHCCLLNYLPNFHKSDIVHNMNPVCLLHFACYLSFTYLALLFSPNSFIHSEHMVCCLGVNPTNKEKICATLVLLPNTTTQLYGDSDVMTQTNESIWTKGSETNNSKNSNNNYNKVVVQHRHHIDK